MTPALTAITLDLTRPWYVITTSAAAPALLAVRELQDHWMQICGQPLLPGAGVESANVIELSVIEHSVSDIGQDGFTWQIESDHVRIEGQSGRGLLFGVYRFLEALGCRWLAPVRCGRVCHACPRPHCPRGRSRKGRTWPALPDHRPLRLYARRD